MPDANICRTYFGKGVQMTFKLAAVATIALLLATLSPPTSAADDACILLTAAEVGAALDLSPNATPAPIVALLI